MTDWEKEIKEKIKTMYLLRTPYFFDKTVDLIKQELRKISKIIEKERAPGFCDCSLLIENELSKRGIK